MTATHEYQLTTMPAETFSSCIRQLTPQEVPAYAGDDVHVTLFLNDTGDVDAIWMGSNRDEYGRTRTVRQYIRVLTDDALADLERREAWNHHHNDTLVPDDMLNPPSDESLRMMNRYLSGEIG